MKTNKKIQIFDDNQNAKKYIEAFLKKSERDDIKITVSKGKGEATDSLKKITYGLTGSLDLIATDINFGENGANFKISYLGNIIPFWSKSASGEKDVLGILSSIAVGILSNMNLVELSQIIKDI